MALYIDCDLSPSADSIPLLLDCARSCDVFTGSRLVPGARVRRGLIREMLSRSYNLTARLVLRSRVRDHQCGLKGIRRSQETISLLKDSKESGWSWDTELLARAQARGLKVQEVAIEWTEAKRTSKVKLVFDVPSMFVALFRIKRGIDEELRGVQHRS